jgi:hypothetical protein
MSCAILFFWGAYVSFCFYFNQTWVFLRIEATTRVGLSISIKQSWRAGLTLFYNKLKICRNEFSEKHKMTLYNIIPHRHTPSTLDYNKIIHEAWSMEETDYTRHVPVQRSWSKIKHMPLIKIKTLYRHVNTTRRHNIILCTWLL